MNKKNLKKANKTKQRPKKPQAAEEVTFFN